MTEDQLNPNICPSALEEDGTLDRSKWDGAHKWHQGSCAECGTTFDTENLFPAILYYYDGEGERNAAVFMTAEATREAAIRYMNSQEWSYDSDSDIDVYTLNDVEDEAGNKYQLEAKA